MFSKFVLIFVRTLRIHQCGISFLHGNKFFANSLFPNGVLSRIGLQPKTKFQSNTQKCELKNRRSLTTESEGEPKELVLDSGTFRILRPVGVTVLGVVTTLTLCEKWREKNLADGTTKRELELLLKQRMARKTSNMYPDETVIQNLKRRWNETPPSRKLLISIIAINSIIFLAWQLPWSPFMYQFFTHIPFSGRTYTLFTSTWSHNALWHILFNMLALWSFGQAACDKLGKERFLGLYLSSGMIAALASHLFHGFTRIPVFSLGASGCIYGIVGSVAYFYPTAKANLLFVLPLSLGPLVKGLAVFEAVGLTGLWRVLMGLNFDHAAHLGGLTTGIVYSYAVYSNKKTNPQKISTRS